MFPNPRKSLTAVVAVLCMLAAACGGESSSDGPTGGSGGESKIVALAGSSTAQQLDPHKYVNIADFQYIAMLYDGLFEFAEGGESKPQLAASGEFSEDGTSYLVTLKEGITFQDGTPIDAEAVKASLERAQTMEESTVAERLSIITGMEVVSPTELEISVTETARNLPEILSGPEGRIVKVVDGDIALDPGEAASGPYELLEFEPGGRAVFERIADYWDEDFKGAQHIEVTPTKDATTRVTALRAGDGDVGSVGGISVNAIEDEIEKGSLDLELEYFFHPTHVLLQFNRTRAPFDDVRVRQAVAHALDLSEAPNSVFGRTATPADAIVPQLDSERPYDFDQDKARALLAEAGLADGFAFEMACYDGDFCKLGEAFQAQLKQVGINMSVAEMPAADLRGRMAEGSLDAALEGLAPVATAATRIQSLLFSPGIKIAELGDGTEHARELFDRTLTQSLSDEEVDQAYQDLNDYVWGEQVWYVPVIYYNNAVLGKPGIDGFARLYDAGTINPRVLSLSEG